MDVQNHELLQSQEALQNLLSARIKGIYALRVRDIAEEAEERVKRISEVRQNLAQQVEDGTVEEENADAEFQEILKETTTIDVEPIPERALRKAELSGQDLLQLDWMIAREEDEEDTDE